MTARARLAVVSLALAAACPVACDDGGAPAPDGAWPRANGVLPADDAAVAAQAALGRLLFYDPILSADGETACATCHSELWGMSDGLPRSIGLGGGRLTGPGRAGPNVLARNAPSLWNVAFREALFWDGRGATLEAQVLLPLEADDELALAPAEAIARIDKIPEYVTLFERAFPDARPPVSLATLERALAAFQRTLVSDDALWDAWMAGDTLALSAEQARGYTFFVEVGCDGCHTPPLFASDTYARREPLSDDPGRFVVTGREADRGAFRTPSLRNARDTAPYFHDGSARTLEDALRRELTTDGVAFDEADVAALAAFLGRGLVDRSREPDRPDTVPSGLPVPEDGFRIPR